MQSWGVSHKPDHIIIDLDQSEWIDRIEDSDEYLGLLIVASDGIWDNWQYADFGALASRIKRNGEKKGKGGVEQCASLLMASNKRVAFENFGNQADNMAIIVCYLKKRVR